MIKKKDLENYNNSLKCDIIGLIKNNHILIVVDKLESNNENEIKQTQFGKFLFNLFGDNWNHISIVPIFKSNEFTAQQHIDIFKKQLSLINPNLVLYTSDISDNYQCELFQKDLYLIKKIETNYFFGFSINCNPMFLITQINNFCKQHAITRITNKKIYYRDIEFQKQEYNNQSDDDIYFIKTNTPSKYKSYDGYNLKLVRNKKSLLHPDENTYEKHLSKKDIFHFNNIQNISYSKILRCMYFDIETDFCNDTDNTPKPIISIAFYDNINDKYYCLVLKHKQEQIINNEKFANHKLKIFENEKEMIEFFLTLLHDNYDLLTGWFSEMFDVPYVFNRSKVLGINLKKYFANLYISKQNNEMKIFQDTIILYDSVLFYKKMTYYNKPTSYSLDNVYKFTFKSKHGKTEGITQQIDEIWRNNIDILIEYNINDVKLLKELIDFCNIINYPLQLQQTCPQDFENVFYNSRTVENLLHHRYWNKGIYFPSKRNHEKRHFEGAIVLEPVKGLHKNVSVLDFSAMYTNIYLSFNFSPDTLIGEKIQVENDFEKIKINLLERYPELLRFFEKYNTQSEFLSQCILANCDFGSYYYLPKEFKIGILPALESEMLMTRKMYNKLRDTYSAESPEYKMYDELQGQAKQILNSIYGITSYDRFILFNDIISSSITTAARELNLWVQNCAKNKKLQPLYSDTDSIFVKFNEDDSFEEFVKKSIEFKKYVNDSFVDFMKTKTSNEVTINTHSNSVDFEKGYLKLLLTDVKKRYFGLKKYMKGKIMEHPELSVTGFETRRDDTPAYFKKLLINCYSMFLEDNYKTKFKDLYKIVKTEIQQQPIDNLVIKIKLSRDTSGYLKSIPIHVRALKNSKATIKRSQIVNMIYVKDSREVLHYDEQLNLKFQIDYDKYLTNFFKKKLLMIDDSIDIIFTNQSDLSGWFK